MRYAKYMEEKMRYLSVIESEGMAYRTLGA